MANILPAPAFFKKKAILLKSEATVGTDAVPTGLLNWIEARNVQFTPLDAQTEERNIDLPYMGHGGKILTGKYVKLAFDVALAGSGAAGTAHKIAPALLACGTAETINAGVSAVYNLVSQSFGALSGYVNIDGTRHKMIGTRGSYGFRQEAQKIPLWHFEFDSVFLAPDESALPTIDRSGWPDEEVVSAATSSKLTLGGVDLAWSLFELSVNNTIEKIDLPGPQVECAITDRQPSGSAIVLAPALSVFDPFAIAAAGTTIAFAQTHGTAAGKQVQHDGFVKIVSVGYDQIKGMKAYRLGLEPTPSSGNDELAHTFL